MIVVVERICHIQHIAHLQRLGPMSAWGPNELAEVFLHDVPTEIARAAELSPVADEHGWRLGRIIDPFGHEWEIGEPIGTWPPTYATNRVDRAEP